MSGNSEYPLMQQFPGDGENSDYIRREAAIDALWNHEKTTRHNLSIYPDIVSEHCEVILDVPAADVRPVVRGHWITEEEARDNLRKGGEYNECVCSVCGHLDWDCTESESFNFCPTCGADMRPAEKEDTE